jgi:hypothetical protein
LSAADDGGMRTKFLARFLAFACLVVVAFAMPALADGGAGAGVVSALSAIPPDVLIGIVSTVIVAVLLPLVFGHLDRGKQDAVLAVTKAAYLVVAAVSVATPMKLDDAIAAVMKRVVDEMGRELKPAEATKVKAIALTMHADPDHPTIVGPTPDELARAINLPRS